jgi:BolA protein
MTGPLAQEIRTLLTAALAPSRLEVINDSHHHAGHAGHDAGGESHLPVIEARPLPG